MASNAEDEIEHPSTEPQDAPSSDEDEEDFDSKRIEQLRVEQQHTKSASSHLSAGPSGLNLQRLDVLDGLDVGSLEDDVYGRRAPAGRAPTSRWRRVRPGIRVATSAGTGT